MVDVRYEDNTGCNDCVIECKDKEQADRMIEAELISAKLYNFKDQSNYDYGDSVDENGHLYTEIWGTDSDYWVRWTRLW